LITHQLICVIVLLYDFVYIVITSNFQTGLNPHFHTLDINDEKSIAELKNYLVDKYGGLDVLVNNAGIAYKVAATDPFAEQAKNTVATNFFGTMKVCDALFPILKPHARVVNVSSSCGYLGHIPSAQLKQKLASPTLTRQELIDLMNEFVA
jgi:carbonyl reductase 1